MQNTYITSLVVSASPNTAAVCGGNEVTIGEEVLIGIYGRGALIGKEKRTLIAALRGCSEAMEGFTNAVALANAVLGVATAICLETATVRCADTGNVVFMCVRDAMSVTIHHYPSTRKLENNSVD